MLSQSRGQVGFEMKNKFKLSNFFKEQKKCSRFGVSTRFKVFDEFLSLKNPSLLRTLNTPNFFLHIFKMLSKLGGGKL